MARPKKDKYKIENLCKVFNKALDETLENKQLPNILKTCLNLGLCREHVYRLMRKEAESVDFDREDFDPAIHTPLCHTIKKFNNWQEVFLFEGMLGGSLNTTACIFALKNNCGWTDKPKEESVEEVAQAIKTLSKLKEVIDNE